MAQHPEPVVTGQRLSPQTGKQTFHHGSSPAAAQAVQAISSPPSSRQWPKSEQEVPLPALERGKHFTDSSEIRETLCIGKA